MRDEDLGRMVNDAWNALGQGFVSWDSMPAEDRETYAAIGRALYDAGFNAGVDSKG